MKIEVVTGLLKALPSPLRRVFYRIPLLRRAGRKLAGANGSAPPREVEILGGPGRGLRMELDLGAEKHLWLGEHEPALQAFLARAVRPGWTVFDVGAHAGFFTLLLGRLGASVFAFEPNPVTRQRLQANIRLNDLLACRAVGSAVADRCGEGLFRPEKNLSPLQGHLVEPDYPLGFRTPPVEPIPVALTTLDEFVSGQGIPAPDLVKIDVEGGEVRVLKGMKRLLAEKRPLVVCEVHNHPLAEEAAALLVAAGYLVSDLETGLPGCPGPELFTQRRYLAAEPGGKA